MSKYPTSHALTGAEAVLDAMRVYFKNRDQSPAEAKLYMAIKIALAEIRGPEIVDPLPRYYGANATARRADP